MLSVMQSDKYLAGIVFIERMNGCHHEVDSQSRLGLNRYVGSRSQLRSYAETLLRVHLCLFSQVGIVDDIQTDKSTVQPAVAHHECRIHDLWHIIQIIERNENLLIVECSRIATFRCISATHTHLYAL